VIGGRLIFLYSDILIKLAGSMMGIAKQRRFHDRFIAEQEKDILVREGKSNKKSTTWGDADLDARTKYEKASKQALDEMMPKIYLPDYNDPDNGKAFVDKLDKVR
jgi:hypothetical protein